MAAQPQQSVLFEGTVNMAAQPQQSVLFEGDVGQSMINSRTTEFDTEIFIDLVREEPCLWNTSIRSYKEQGKRRNAWSKISKVFG